LDIDRTVVVVPLQASNPSGIAWALRSRCNTLMGTKSREVIWAGRILGAKIRAEGAREDALKAVRAADRAEAEAWSIRMEGYGGPAQPSPTIAQCLNGGLGWLEVRCHPCETKASIPLDAVRRSRDTPIWKLEGSFRCNEALPFAGSHPQADRDARDHSVQMGPSGRGEVKPAPPFVADVRPKGDGEGRHDS
jgi:hypothetical protein